MKIHVFLREAVFLRKKTLNPVLKELGQWRSHIVFNLKKKMAEKVSSVSIIFNDQNPHYYSKALQYKPDHDKMSLRNFPTTEGVDQPLMLPHSLSLLLISF